MAHETTSLLGLERVNLRQQAVIALREAITSGEIPAGTHLAETDLAQRLQISRGTLREALRELQQQGLVTAGARGRLSVRQLTAADEQSGRERLDRSAHDEDLMDLGGDRQQTVALLSAAVKRLEDAETLGLEARIEADLDFHRTLCVLTGNQTLLTTWGALEGAIRLSIMYGGVERADENMDAHRHADIVDSIASGDADRARETIMAHMAHAAANLVRRSDVA
jgi:DNA-binding FadR family transcriptional regulator